MIRALCSRTVLVTLDISTLCPRQTPGGPLLGKVLDHAEAAGLCRQRYGHADIDILSQKVAIS